jgi:uncharacterized membrane protein YiaA
MTLLSSIYILCALTGTLSLIVLSHRALPYLNQLDANTRKPILNRMLLAAGLASFGGVGIVSVTVFNFDAPYSLVSAGFFGLLFTRSTFGALKVFLRRQVMTPEEDE